MSNQAAGPDPRPAVDGFTARPYACGIGALVLCLVSLHVSEAATRYDPRLRFRTISTPRFDIHFHQGAESVARRLAALVDEAAADVDRAIGSPVGRVQIILVDQHDLSNGWATPLPYNTIEISAAAPSAQRSIGNTSDWLRLVFVHEYTHIAHLSRASGWIGGLRRPFGRLPVLFPNLYQPLWGIEGVATWSESAFTGQGRVPAGDFRQLIARAAAAGRFEPLDRANGGNVDWPSGATPYVYGAYFHEYLAGRYGAASLRRLADETSRRLPYLGSRAYQKVFGRSLGQLWKEFASVTAAGAARQSAPTVQAVRLTRHGFEVSGPRHAPDGRVFYSAASPHHFPALFELAADQPRHVALRYLGNSIAIAGDRLLIDEIDLVRNVGLKSDLYLVHPGTGDRRRVTEEARAADPDVSGDGNVVCTIQFSDRRVLAAFRLPDAGELARPGILIDEEVTDFSAPRWSPDGRLIAAERRRLGGRAQIVVIDRLLRTVRVLADFPGGRTATPAWSPDGQRVLFAAAHDREPFQLFSVELADGSLRRLEGTGPDAHSPDVSPDGRSLVFVGYTPDGYDVFRISLTEARWTPWTPPRESAEPSGSSGMTPAGPPDAGRDYSAWSTLTPRFWTPIVASDAGELIAGGATGSADALGRHAYGIQAAWAQRASPDWQAAYTYDRWHPTLFVSAAEDTDPWRDGLVRTRELDAGVLWRHARVRYSLAQLTAIHFARDSFDCVDCTPVVDADRTRGSLRLGWRFSNARSFGYSISAEEGRRLSLTMEATRTALGADGNGLAVTAEAREYRRLGLPHAVVALRAAAAGSWGHAAAERRFTAAGPGSGDAGFDFGTDAVGLLRGFDRDDATGTRVVMANADYRVPLLRIGRGAGTLPVFARSLHAAIFADAGAAWTERTGWSDALWSAGVELSVDTVVGYVLPVSLTMGGAWRRDGGSGRFVAFGRIGRAF